jgi:hypothetical protein
MDALFILFLSYMISLKPDGVRALLWYQSATRAIHMVRVVDVTVDSHLALLTKH